MNTRPAAVARVALCPGGPWLSAVVAGAWRLASWPLDEAGRRRWIEGAVELGITSFDHADIYGDYQSETLFGAALAASPGLRERIQLITKFGIKLVSPARPEHAVKSYDSSRGHLVASVENSLRALRTDRIDLLLVHRPDALMDPDPLVEGFAALKAAGKVLHVGVSNHGPSQFALLHRRHPLATNQIEFSPLQLAPLADGTLDQALDLGCRPMAWSPLAGGRLLAGADPQAARVRAVLQAMGEVHRASVATMAYAWVLRHPAGPLPITGSGRLEALAEAATACALPPMAGEDWYRVWQASTGQEVP